ncbi:MAG: gfo/Idh/MocA family oxidoreductase, partial [Planctomycetes bacterium]|nr:gfo/Idh/MocA family oxidoreductase [Planctomycetota bacterium]
AEAGFSKPEVWNVEIPISGDSPQHKGIMRNFVKAIQDGEELIACGTEGINGVQLCNSMIFSAFNDCTVTLPVDGDAYEKMLNKLIAESTYEKKVVKQVAADMSGTF